MAAHGRLSSRRTARVRRAAASALLTGVLTGAVVGASWAIPSGTAAAASPIPPASAPASAPVSALVSAQETPSRISAGDRDLLVRVRLAGLWEMPAGRMATVKGASARVRQVGDLIMSQHQRLDALVRKAASAVGVTLPDRPNTDQRYWLQEMQRAQGRDFDRIFVQRLREAHGQILPRIALVRSDTRDPVVRALADAAADFVKTHLSLLESTGLVDYTRLPPVSEPAPDENRFVVFDDPRYAGRDDRIRQIVVLTLVGMAGVITLVLVVRICVPRFGSRVARPPQPAPPHRRHRPAPGPAEPSPG